MFARNVLAVFIAFGVLIGSWHPAAAAKQPRKGGSNPHYQVYLLKGLADVFSTGMDFLQAKLQARGIEGEVHSHAAWQSLARTAIAKWRGGQRGPIIIIGHSLGADAAVAMAQRLGESQVPVALLVTFSPVDSAPAMANVARAVNYFQSNSAWHGQITRGAGFRGSLENIDLAQTPGITHFNIEKVDQFHAATISKVLSLVSAPTRTASRNADASSPQSTSVSATNQ
jgi:thioesterase domain-containing protein